jgi:putative alpha-1,2-mannosidase
LNKNGIAKRKETMKTTGLWLLLFFSCLVGMGQSNVKDAGVDIAGKVNVFLGTSADHGQMSPAACSPFGMLSICPQTYPSIHTGYEYAAKQYKGFVHTLFEGVGCRGSGGNILFKPFVGNDPTAKLEKITQSGSPGFYEVSFTNGIQASVTVLGKEGIHHYQMPKGPKGFLIDFKYTLANGFVAEEHHVEGNTVSGWVEAHTTCGAGKYKWYYCFEFTVPVKFTESTLHTLVVTPDAQAQQIDVHVGLSSIDTSYARKAISGISFKAMKASSRAAWNTALGKIKVEGAGAREALFYSELYRTMQSPFMISEPDGNFRATNGNVEHAVGARYNGWSVWDNYHTQLPLLSLIAPHQYQDIITSLASLYRYGKKGFATNCEPTNTVRTEHSLVVLLDALQKGYTIELAPILDSLDAEGQKLDFSTPDKALESCYDCWALSALFGKSGRPRLAASYAAKASQYKTVWRKEFADLTAKDVDQSGARGMYQGTIWQYRWLVPYDMKGLLDIAGGDSIFTQQLDQFFDRDLYNHANEPDIEAPTLYNATSQPWKSQRLTHVYAVDTVVQYYIDGNVRGVDPFMDVAFKNEPKAYIRTMDDDAGAMSGWFVFASIGFMPACVGEPVYYLHVPLFPKVQVGNFRIEVTDYSDKRVYLSKIVLNGKELHRNYLTHEELMQGGSLKITASDQPNTSLVQEKWVSEMKAQ